MFRVYYWGKIQGLSSDFLIAMGLGSKEISYKDESLKTCGEITVAEFFDTLKLFKKKFFRLGWVQMILIAAC